MRNQQSTKKLRLEGVSDIQPKTRAQGAAFEHWENGNNLILDGSAGSGKTFIGMVMALEEALDPNTPCNKVIVVRSVVPTRQIGFLPGDEEEKIEVYAKPYIHVAAEIFNDKQAWQKLSAHKQIFFESTSFVRSLTWDNAIVLVDEMQNLNFHELDSIITRLGVNSRIIFAGDFYQSDFQREDEKNGLLKFINLVRPLRDFEHVEFKWHDIVRGPTVKAYIEAKEQAKKDGDLPLDY